MNYRRITLRGEIYFFTLVTHQRKKIFSDPINISLLKKSFARVKAKHPFKTIAIVILPDHLHCLWQLPFNDSDYSKRWRLIKFHYTRMQAHQDGTIWQKRYWEHVIRNETDYAKHLAYIHYNPVKHGYVKNPGDWKYSTFRKFVANGVYDPRWAMYQEPNRIRELDFE